MDTKLVAQKRSKLGTSENRRLRLKGFVPGNVYGHKQDNISVMFPAKEVTAFVNTTHRVVNIELDGKIETTILRETQWDTFHTKLQHVDFLRVDANERVNVDVDIVLKGTSPGVLAGGLLDHPLHAVHVDCLAIKIPDGIIVKLGALHTGQVIHVKDLEVPDGVKVLNSPDAIVVRVINQVVVEEPTGELGSGAEPEVIKKEKKSGEEDDKSGKK
ncbi:MAG: 50S ribosomal protein L25 [Pirellulaceae bacterium]